jgi:aspartyl-tRNA(Asn)/glutamyl-tRNA(Gln) amidotransferase subunit B
MPEFEPVIGLEIHAQLATQSKLFCACPTEFGRPPNENTCPVCLGLPGVLPVANRRAIELAVRLGLATHCTIRLDSQFARKNYFYPDLPKAYQISQYDRPLCEHGWVEIVVDGRPKRVGITRIHVEEDAGKLVHEGADANATYVDLNRAGVPLVEIVSEPELSSPEEAQAYMQAIHELVTYLGVGNGNMEQGNLRADANISLRIRGESKLGTRTETKNINSFRFVREALAYEIERQREELLDGRPIVQETRLYDPERKLTYPMRSKEEAHDYRYFPEPDLPVVRLDAARVEVQRAALPELPDEKRARYQRELGLSEQVAKMLVAQRDVADYFEQSLTAASTAVFGGNIPDDLPKRNANWIMGPLAAKVNEDKISYLQVKAAPEDISRLMKLVDDGTISSKIAKDVFDEMYASGEHPEAIVQAQGLRQVSDTGALEGIIDQIITENPEQVEQFRAGKERVLGFFVGRVMKATGGQANPAVVNDLLKAKLAG